MGTIFIYQRMHVHHHGQHLSYLLRLGGRHGVESNEAEERHVGEEDAAQEAEEDFLAIQHCRHGGGSGGGGGGCGDISGGVELLVCPVLQDTFLHHSVPRE